MKNRISKLIAIITFVLMVSSVQASANGSVFDGYKITPIEKQDDTKAGIEKGWSLSYAKSKSPIVITLRQTKKSKTYLVRTSHFEVAYVSSDKGFGARPVKMSESIIPDELTNQVINLDELSRQRIISDHNVDEKTALELIVGYLPDLLNTHFQHLLTD